MISKKEIKDLVIALGKKYFFPDFTNKLTWFVVTVGGAVILTPTVFKQIFYNWLVATFNLNSGIQFTFAELESSTADYTIGCSLIALALLHNIMNRYFIYKVGDIVAANEKELEAVDRNLFERFLSEFPSDSQSVTLLKEHDFGNSYHDNNTNEIDHFVDTWNTAEREFLDLELEAARKKLHEKMHDFIYKLAQSSGFIHTGPMMSAVPDAYRGAWNWPEHVDIRIKELNEKSAECYKLHQQFVMLGRRKLKC
ncbi:MULTISPECIES: hypothetical protein [Aeromonas]|uniref:hypothetical protein n=1 Tax=Aeromonas TaxID=642 RepID=UPI001330788E|nr:hypothetical protein [Aeromonas salmonicida]